MLNDERAVHAQQRSGRSRHCFIRPRATDRATRDNDRNVVSPGKNRHDRRGSRFECLVNFDRRRRQLRTVATGARLVVSRTTFMLVCDFIRLVVVNMMGGTLYGVFMIPFASTTYFIRTAQADWQPQGHHYGHQVPKCR